MMQLSQIAVSPCSNPAMELEDLLASYSDLGYRYFECFTSWVESAFDYRKEPRHYLDAGRRHGMEYISLHLPEIRGEKIDGTLRDAIRAARFGKAIGAQVVLYKCEDKRTYIDAARPFLDAIEGFGVLPVLQNHFGTALSTLEDVKTVFEEIADPRMHTLLEVGHYHSAGVTWFEAAEYLGDTIALVHIKDQIGKQSVPFGQGEIDLHGLFRYMDNRDYAGRYVIEMEVRDEENTLEYLAGARDFVVSYCEEGMI